jgi:hypothetical protein
MSATVVRAYPFARHSAIAAWTSDRFVSCERAC